MRITRRRNPTHIILTLTNDPGQDPDEDLDEDFEDYKIDESEATALNAMEELEDSSEGGHASLCWLPTLPSVKPVARARAQVKAKARARAKSCTLTLPWSRDATSCAL